VCNDPVTMVSEPRPRDDVDLARRFFDLLGRKDYEGLRGFLHPEVVFAPMMFPGTVFEGRDQVLARFYELVFTLPAYEPHGARFGAVADGLVLVEGSVHFVDDRGSIHDKSAFWVLGFQDGKLRSLRGKGSRADARRLAEELAAERVGA
jgi:ketosteroid isomerase-like protein